MAYFRSVSLASLFLASLLSVTGCGSKEKIVAVSGKVTHKGQPVPGLVISFVPEAQTETGVSTGETDENGTYHLTVVKSGVSGAVVGTHKVWVSLPRKPLDGDKDTSDDKGKEDRAKTRAKKAKASKLSTEDMAAILKIYGRLDNSPLTKEVTDGSPIDFQLD